MSTNECAGLQMRKQANDSAGSQPATRRQVLRRFLKFCALAIIAVVVAAQQYSYWFVCGLIGKPGSSLAFELTIGLFPIALVAVVYLLYRVVLKLVRWRVTRFWTMLAYAALLLCLFVAPIFVPREAHLRGFYFWAKSHVDIPSTVAWAEQFQVPPDCPKQEGHEYVNVPVESLPASIQSVFSHTSYEDRKYGPFFRYDKRTKSLALVWSAGHGGGWGITIGHDIVKRASSPKCVDWQDMGYPQKPINDDAYMWWREQ